MSKILRSCSNDGNIHWLEKQYQRGMLHQDFFLSSGIWTWSLLKYIYISLQYAIDFHISCMYGSTHTLHNLWKICYLWKQILRKGISKGFPHVFLMWLQMSNQNYHNTWLSVEVSDNSFSDQQASALPLIQ